ncbi:MAG: hypothetical protein WBM66_16635, partial [Thiothrix litoralis]
ILSALNAEHQQQEADRIKALQKMQQRETHLEALEHEYATREASLLQHLDNLAAITSQHQQREAERHGFEQKLEQRDKVLNLKDTIIAQLNQQLLHKEKAMQQRDALLQKLGQQLRIYNATA